MLEAQNISLKKVNHEILKDISLTANSGEVVCIIGQSGCGKTTLLKSLALINKPDSGTIKINNNIFLFPSKNTSFNIYPDLTIVFQQFQLFPHLTVLENINLILNHNNIPLSYDTFFEIISFFDLEKIIDRYPHQISMGQRQRVAFIRAILLNPSILLLDEITSALDVESTKKISDFLIKQKKQGTTIILSTHTIGLARQLADMIYFMDNGKIIEFGNTTILENPQTDRLNQFLSISL